MAKVQCGFMTTMRETDSKECLLVCFDQPLGGYGYVRRTVPINKEKVQKAKKIQRKFLPAKSKF